MKTIFDRTRIPGLDMKNRIFRSATWDGLAAADGSLPEEIYDRYRELAKGGAGAAVTGLMDVFPPDIKKRPWARRQRNAAPTGVFYSHILFLALGFPNGTG